LAEGQAPGWFGCIDARIVNLVKSTWVTSLIAASLVALAGCSTPYASSHDRDVWNSLDPDYQADLCSTYQNDPGYADEDLFLDALAFVGFDDPDSRSILKIMKKECPRPSLG
jgi:hypothetical protein